MTPADVITLVRPLIQDTDPVTENLRYTDELLLSFVNQTLRRMVVLRPDLFVVTEHFHLDPDTPYQHCPADALRLVELHRVAEQAVLVEVDRLTLDRTHPRWQIEPVGVPRNYMRHLHSPTSFFVSPIPDEAYLVVGEYVRTPPRYRMKESITHPPQAYMAAIVDGTVYLAESIDNEHASSGRAQMYENAFLQFLGAGIQSAPLVDAPPAMQPPLAVGRSSPSRGG